MNQTTDTSAVSLFACDDGFDPIEDRMRANIRSTIETVFNEELNSFLGRLRYGREAGAVKGYRHGQRDRRITGTFGTETISVPRARVEDHDGKAREWRSKALPRYQRLTKRVEGLIASVYLAGTNTRRVKRALFALFKWTVCKDVVSRKRHAPHEPLPRCSARAAGRVSLKGKNPGITGARPAHRRNLQPAAHHAFRTSNLPLLSAARRSATFGIVPAP